MTYDFTTLSPEDFEHLIADIFSREWGARLESFKPGRDGGIDLRHSRVPQGVPKTIVQCKRYAPHKFSQLLSNCKKERKKLEKINPERYVLVTTVGLTPENKKELLEVFSPWCKGTGDIYGPEEINGMLSKYRDIERSHFKLWIASTAVLEQVLHSNIFGVTAATVQATKEQLSRLVVHKGMDRALELLGKNHHLLIVGNPGIGKSTLARMLMCHYMHEDFEPVWVVGNISEAWSIIHATEGSDRKSVVVYDDFLGRLQFESLRFDKNEDQSLMQLLDKAARSPNIRLILTTREYIVADAKRVHGAFDMRAHELLSYTLSLREYTTAHRAQMVFNHLYFSDLPSSRLEALVESKAYLKVVNHVNFNPRIVESICMHANSHSMTDSKYVEFFESEFDNPAKLWEHPFKNEISPLARQILVALWSFNGTADIALLRASVSRLNPLKAPEEFSIEFDYALQQLDGNFISTDRLTGFRADQKYLIAQFQNPSVEEFIEGIATTETSWLSRIGNAAESMVQISKVASQARKAEVALPREFWMSLREYGASLGQRKHGHVLNVSYSGELETRRIWSVEDDSLPDITLELLRIDADAGVKEDRASSLHSRVLTTEGWSKLLARVPTNQVQAFHVARLQRWIVNQSGWSSDGISMSRQALVDAFMVVAESKEDDIDLGSLLELVEVSTLNGAVLRHSEKEKIVSMIETRIENLRCESMPDEVEREAGKLEKLADLFNLDYRDVVLELKSIAEELEEQPDWNDTSSEQQRYTVNENATFDINSLFADLLDR